MVLFVGRADQLGDLGAELDQAQACVPRLVVVEGPAGMGKTRLVDVSLKSSDGLVIRRALADPTESHAPYGVVEQLLGADFSTATPAPSMEPLAVGALVLDLLGRLQALGCVVLVVDDAHWADHVSLQALLFCLRRLQADRVLLLLAVRSEEAHRLPQGVERLLSSGRGSLVRLPGLTLAQAADLVAGSASRHRRRPSCAVSSTTPEATRCTWSPSSASCRQRSSRRRTCRCRRRACSRGPSPLQLDRCSEEARRLVQAVAVAGGDVPVSQAAAIAGVRHPLAAVDEAVASGMLVVRGAAPALTLRPAHPLIGAGAYQGLSPSERAARHLAASRATSDPAARLRHLVSGSQGPDEPLALQVAEFARSQASTGSIPAAVAALLSASRVTASRSTREELVLEAIELSLFAADIPTALDLGAGLDGFRPGARLSWVRGLLAGSTGAWDQAEELLLDAWHRANEPAARAERSRLCRAASRCAWR